MGVLNKLIFASHNVHKAKEISGLLHDLFEIVSLNDIGFHDEIIESGTTLQENARIKAQTIFEAGGLDCFADDTGLLVDALDGQPGVYSARYAGSEKDSNKNMDKLLFELHNQANRRARFVTVICLIYQGETYFFEGVLEGEIGSEKKGHEGFGYDPVFIPLGSEKTLAEMSLDEKNKMSHRARAFEKMLAFMQLKRK